MTKALASAYREDLLDSSAPNLSSVNLKVAGMSSSYVYSAAHDFLNDVTNIITTSGNLAGKTITGGTLDATDLAAGSPAAGSTITQFWLYHDTGVSSTSQLIYYWNEDSAGSAIAIATTGDSITIVWNASGIFTV